MKKFWILCLLIPLLLAALGAAGSAVTIGTDSGVYTGQMTVVFTTEQRHTVTVTCEGSGTVTAEGYFDAAGNTYTVLRGRTLILAITPAEGYILSEVHVSSADGVTMEDGSMTIAGVEKDYTVQLVFVEYTPDEIWIEPERSVLLVGEQVRLQVLRNYETDNTAAVWTAVDGTVATVSADGLVTAVAPGRTEVTVDSDDLTAACAVYVVSPILDGDILYLPAQLTVLGSRALENTAARKVVIPAGCTDIGAWAVSGENLREIRIEAPDVDIDKDAFAAVDADEVIFFAPDGSAAETWLNEHGYLTKGY